MTLSKRSLFKNLKIRTLALLVISLVLVSGVIFVGSSVMTSSNISEAQHLWNKYKADTSPKSKALNSIVEHLGYGGMIHHFKNYALRKDTPRIAKFQVSAGAAMAALDQYGNTDPSAEEAAALAALRNTVTDYSQKILAVNSLAAEGKTAREIDQTVKISDKAALDGLAVLAKVAQNAHAHGADNTKTELVQFMRTGFGYGGMIHQFKNYVLRQDAPRIEKVHKAMSNVLVVIEEYRSLKINDQENQALTDIAGVIEAYKVGLVKATKLASSGQTPEQIDKQVKVSDGPAIKGLATLVNLAGREMAADGALLSKDLAATTKITNLVQIVAVVSSLLLIILVYIVLFQRILRPVSGITKAMTSLANGDDEADVSAFSENNEIGEMASAVQVFKDHAIERARLEKKASGDAVGREKRQQAVDNLIVEFRSAVDKSLSAVTANAQTMTSTAKALTDTAVATGERASNSVAASTDALSNVQTVSAAAEELSVSISEISRQVVETEGMVSNATSTSQDANSKVAGLADAAVKIGDVVSLISDIAEQTNLLALNATIEAARAGDAGKGFAVVASEVKALASQTAKATEEISQQINTIQGSTNDTVGAINAIAKKMDDVNESIGSISSSVGQQGLATGEISQNVSQAADGTSKVVKNIEGVNTAVDDITDSATQVTSAAIKVDEEAQYLNKIVGNFLKEVAAA